ncbi:MAG: tetratricopeptide repeat protein [Burkholderiales bacterium]|nr:tetratricopeptide repeat protein [Burkholderiales bacterium]
MEWEQRLSQLWAALDNGSTEGFVAQMRALCGELPADSAIAAFELASSLDSTGQSALATPLYRQALHNGLEGERRRRASIQLASSLRSIGQIEESIQLLRAEQTRTSDHLDDAVSAFLALALAQAGQERAATALALTALARHLPRYQRSLSNYAHQLAHAPGAEK